MHIETKCLHEGYKPGNGEPKALPIYQSTTYTYDSTEHIGQLFDLSADGHMYSRISNPTVAAVEQKIAALEGGVGALCTTSGQAASAPQGAALLRQLTERAGKDVEILAGAGVSAQNIPVLAAQTGVRAFHLSGKQVLQSRMTFRREGVPMGLPGFSEFEVWQTSEANIRAARQALDSL